ncbi:MAG: hypothetical protein AABY26_01475, partial [Nanoarchaeota archaeon]
MEKVESGKAAEIKKWYLFSIIRAKFILVYSAMATGGLAPYGDVAPTMFSSRISQMLNKYKKWEWNKELFNAKIILICLMLFFIGLLPYLYLPIRSSMNPVLDYGNPENWENFWSHITAEKYSTQYLGETFPIERLATLALTLFAEWSWWLFFLIIGLFFFLREKNNPLRIPFTISIIGYALFYIFYGIQDIASYSLPLLLLLSLPLAEGISKACSLTAKLSVHHHLKSKIFHTHFKAWPKKALMTLVVAALAANLFLFQFPASDYHSDYSAEEYADTVFSQLPQKAVLVTNHDENAFLIYLQLTEHQRQDLTIIPLTCFLDNYCLQQIEKGNFIFSTRTI